MSKDNDARGEFTISEWVDSPFVEYDHTDRAKAELDPLVQQLADKADEIGVPVFVALQVSQNTVGAGYSSTISWQETGHISGGMLALEDALQLDVMEVIKARAAQVARLEKHGIIPSAEASIH